jgi:hypothetical protein
MEQSQSKLRRTISANCPPADCLGTKFKVTHLVEAVVSGEQFKMEVNMATYSISDFSFQSRSSALARQLFCHGFDTCVPL